jgi:hypothetical protein
MLKISETIELSHLVIRKCSFKKALEITPVNTADPVTVAIFKNPSRISGFKKSIHVHPQLTASEI